MDFEAGIVTHTVLDIIMIKWLLSNYIFLNPEGRDHYD